MQQETENNGVHQATHFHIIVIIMRYALRALHSDHPVIAAQKG